MLEDRADQPAADQHTRRQIARCEGEALQLRYQQSGTNTWLSVDIDGDAVTDVQVLCVGLIDFTAADFV